MKHKIMTMMLVVGTGMLGACSIFDKNLGASVDNNTRAQVVDPNAGHGKEVATLDGQKAEKLLKDYRTEKAKAPTERLLKDIGG